MDICHKSLNFQPFVLKICKFVPLIVENLAKVSTKILRMFLDSIFCIFGTQFYFKSVNVTVSTGIARFICLFSIVSGIVLPSRVRLIKKREGQSRSFDSGLTTAHIFQ